MKIEKEKIRLLPIDLVQIKQAGKLKSRNTGSVFNLSAHQIEILELFNKTFSLYEVVHHFFKKGQLVSFSAINVLLKFLIEEGHVVNESFRDYFIKQNIVENLLSKFFDKFSNEEAVKNVNKYKIKELPFFRNLAADTVQVLIKHSRMVEVPSGVTLCQQGMLQRSLLVLLSGQASVLKKNEKGQVSKKHTLIESSIFGEVGFFFDEPRSASVVTDTKCNVLVMQYIPELYDDMVNFEKSNNLQSRIKLIQALNSSSIFKDLPQECFDSLIFAGEVKTLPINFEICKEGDIGNACYVIIEGQVKVSKGGISVANLGVGDCFGEMALVVSQGKRTATVQALTELSVLEISTSRFY